MAKTTIKKWVAVYDRNKKNFKFEKPQKPVKK